MVGGSSLGKEKAWQIKIKKEMPYGSMTCRRLGKKYGKMNWL